MKKRRSLKNNFYIKLIINQIILSSILIIFGSPSFSNDKINVSEQTFSRIQNYYNGDFYSVENDNRIFNVVGIYFIISDDGKFSVISYCKEEKINCDLNLQEFKANYRCKKISQQNCRTLFYEKNIVINHNMKKIKKIKSKEELNNFFTTYKDNNEGNFKKFISDLEIITYKEMNSNDSFN